MKLIQNFSSLKKDVKMKITDILIWKVGLKQYKKLGYYIKLYCEETDLDFLKYWGLYEYFDEFDISFLSNNRLLKKINQTHFWSSRKIECIKHEFDISNDPFIYSDTDIIMEEVIPYESYDFIAWSPEDEISIYPEWKYLSVPLGYKMPKFIQDTRWALNAGIIYFKNKENFYFYRKCYLDFILNNPCVIYDSIGDYATFKNVWACNSEQRILKAVKTYLNLKTLYIMGEQSDGSCSSGIHYFYYRAGWRIASLEDKLEKDLKERWIKFLNEEIIRLLDRLDEKEKEIFLKEVWIYNLYINNIYTNIYQ